MDPLLALFLLGLICMVSMVPMMFFGGHRHWMAWHSDRPTPFDGHEATAREILDRRYANGEITNERYQAMLTDLGTRAAAE